MTQLHISQLGLLSVCSAPLLEDQGGEENREGVRGGGKKKREVDRR